MDNSFLENREKIVQIAADYLPSWKLNKKIRTRISTILTRLSLEDIIKFSFSRVSSIRDS